MSMLAKGWGTMECFEALIRLKCFLYHQLVIFIFWLYGVHNVISLETVSIPSSLSPNMVLLTESPISSFDPIDISPAVVPHYPYRGVPLSPMYPSFPTTYEPILTGKCPVNFTSIANILNKTACDCSAPLAALVGNVICCPQVSSLVHIFQGSYSHDADALILHKAAANNCFSDIMSILTSRGANSSVPTLCSVHSSNLTGGSCPVKDVTTFEKKVNTSKLLEACSAVDSLRECCRPVCQPAIAEAAFHISSTSSSLVASPILGGNYNAVDLTDCKGVVYAWLARKLSSDAANTAFRTLSSCKVNKGCPLDFKKPSAVIKACSEMVSPNLSCCSSLNTYIVAIQNQMLITNRQAINCATTFGSMLQKGGVMTDVYELCDIDLKDFSLQAYGHQGCLLRSLPTDIIIDQSAGLSFTCDLSDNVAAPWPSSSLVPSLSLCVPEMSLPALPTSQKSGHPGDLGSGIRTLIPIFLAFVFTIQP